MMLFLIGFSCGVIVTAAAFVIDRNPYDRPTSETVDVKP